MNYPSDVMYALGDNQLTAQPDRLMVCAASSRAYEGWGDQLTHIYICPVGLPLGLCSGFAL